MKVDAMKVYARLCKLCSSPSQISLSLGARLLIALIALFGAGMTQAAAIYVDGVACQLSDAITAANTDSSVFGCSAGAGADTLILLRDIKLQAGALPRVTSDITIEYSALAAQHDDCDSDDDEEREDPTPVPTSTPNRNPNPTPNPNTNPDPTPDGDPPDDPEDPPTRDNPPDDPEDPPIDEDPPSDPEDPPTGDPPGDPEDPPDDTEDPPGDPNDPPTGDPPGDPEDPPTDPPDGPELPPFSDDNSFDPTPIDPTGDPEATPESPDPGDPGGFFRSPDMPEHCLHIVRRDETLYRISLRHGMTVREVSSFNKLLSDDRLLAGQELIIPYDDCLAYVPLKG